ncbi:hypothetical protein B0I35DRAFT_103071 [Stachybotrys elegans]|uniref:Uncharacterized protein n=1 Tax=Stachybotrys elegans TaxID=80388 RepID=A0A8K0SEZ8_9HYPO|nr:hypothetical protein B0I35DRAFT_103071 [Stachybotrys elegans]
MMQELVPLIAMGVLIPGPTLALYSYLFNLILLPRPCVSSSSVSLTQQENNRAPPRATSAALSRIVAQHPQVPRLPDKPPAAAIDSSHPPRNRLSHGHAAPPCGASWNAQAGKADQTWTTTSLIKAFSHLSYRSASSGFIYTRPF